MTVLAYAVGEKHALRKPCRRLLRAHGEGLLEATTTIEAIQEFTHIRAKRRTRADAVGVARHYIVSLRPIVTTTEDLNRGLELFERHPQLGAFDVVLAAVAIEHGAEALVYADQAFGSIPNLHWIDAATPAIEPLLAGLRA